MTPRSLKLTALSHHRTLRAAIGDREFGKAPAFPRGAPTVPGTPHAPIILFVNEINGSHSLPLRQDAGYVLSSFLLRLAFDVERLIFSTPRAQGRHPDHMSGDVPHFHFHFLAKTLLEDDAGQPFPDADAALRHAEFLAVQLSEGGHLVGSSILVAKDNEVIFEVPLSRLIN